MNRNLFRDIIPNLLMKVFGGIFNPMFILISYMYLLAIIKWVFILSIPVLAIWKVIDFIR